LANKLESLMIQGLREIVGSYIASLPLTSEEKNCFWQSYMRLGGENSSVKGETKTEPLSLSSCQQQLAHINERTARRKKDGVYYTDEDLTEYMVYNAFYSYVDDSADNVHNVDDILRMFKEYPSTTIEHVLRASTFDPTCGAGEFLLSAAKFKYKLRLILDRQPTDRELARILSTFHGNDIETDSIFITQIRLFLQFYEYLNDKKNVSMLEDALRGHFTVDDYVTNIRDINRRYDVMIGNPPYVEYSNLDTKPQGNFGNAYCDVLNNVTRELKSTGSMAFIVPLSYVSTPRMNAIREIYSVAFKKQFILSFADRPDCLFVGAHQKLCIIIASRKSTANTQGIYTSTYYYWYKSERDKLFNSLSVYKNVYVSENGAPKIGNLQEFNLYQKTHLEGRSLLSCLFEHGKTKPLYLNMRGCFWMKAFNFDPGSGEYKQFSVRNDDYGYIMCILNSSLFFTQWIALSDCWHITRKELNSFSVPEIDDDQKKRFSGLASRLSKKLELTKEYIGSKQVDYEYKHKLCKDVIDKIDTALMDVYDLNDEEINYVKSFKLKYRLSNDEQ